MQKWTEEQDIAFECARECILHLKAIWLADIAAMESSAEPNDKAIHAAKTQVSMLSGELRSLHFDDFERVSWVRREYGRQVRERLGQQISRPDSL